VCGIAGKVSLDRAVDASLLEQMCAVIEHRGPDSRGTFREDGVGLGVQRLAIIDLETGDQPIFNEDESIVVLQNGEIYNYRELRRELEARGHRFSTQSDTEVIVHLYEDHGDACVDRLRGMFAFAIWDRRRRRLLLGRDRVGKKPLFYAVRNGSLWFASEAKSILQDPDVPRDVDLDAIDCFLQFQYVPHPKSAFAALRKLPPAHLLSWEDGRIETRRYWKLSYSPDDHYASEEEMHERIRSELLDATRLRLRSDVPLGAFLSGGVDSSAVVAAMARLSSTPVKTFSIGFDVESFDETPHARRIAELFATDHHEFRVEPQAMEILPRLVWHYGEPFADQSAIPSFYLAELTRRHVTVALNGDGGDEDFAGYPRYVANALMNRLDWVPPALARAAAWSFDRIGPGPAPRSPRTRLRRLARGVSLAPYDRYAMWIAYFAERDRAELYTPELRSTLGAARTAPSVIREPWLESNARAYVDRMLDVDVNTHLPGDLLVKMDIATMAHSLEVRSPFLDHCFMEMAARLPAESKLRGRTTKLALKDAMRPWIPDRILERRKMGFGVPIGDWFRGPLRGLPGEVLLDPRSLDRGLFREEALRGIIERHISGREDTSNKIWALLQLELWMRTYVDASRPQRVATSVT
jgi:asparagine synthase (glutamine-hydrolysing)